jgi:hypothetical protein
MWQNFISAWRIFFNLSSNAGLLVMNASLIFMSEECFFFIIERYFCSACNCRLINSSSCIWKCYSTVFGFASFLMSVLLPFLSLSLCIQLSFLSLFQKLKYFFNHQLPEYNFDRAWCCFFMNLMFGITWILDPSICLYCLSNFENFSHDFFKFTLIFVVHSFPLLLQGLVMLIF